MLSNYLYWRSETASKLGSKFLTALSSYCTMRVIRFLTRPTFGLGTKKPLRQAPEFRSSGEGKNGLGEGMNKPNTMSKTSIFNKFPPPSLPSFPPLPPPPEFPARHQPLPDFPCRRFRRRLPVPQATATWCHASFSLTTLYILRLCRRDDL